MARPENYFDSELISRLRRQELTARRVVDGFLAGRNRSNRHGHSVEFVEHREYAPGDDLRHLDWKVLGRMDRYYIKRYEEETNITAMLLVDVSASMAFRSDERSKFELAAFAATALGYLLTRQGDGVGMALFDTDVRTVVPPRAKRVVLSHMARQLLHTETRGKTALAPIVKKVSEEVPKRCLFVILSDLFVEPADFQAAVNFLHVRGHDALVIQTLDHAERHFPFRAPVLFRGLEDQRELLTEPRRIRTRYLELLEEHISELRRACVSVAYDHVVLSGDEPLAPALSALLAARARRKSIVRRGSNA